jgi:hypothetical protein
MAHVRSTAHPCDDIPIGEGEGVIVERGVADEGHDSANPAERTESARASDVGSQSSVKGESDGGSHTRN